MFKKKRTKSVPLPQEFAKHVPVADHGQPFERVDDDSIVLAGRHALMIVSPEGVRDSGLWHEVQYARWTPNERMFHLVWVQPGRQTISLKTDSEDPERLMSAVTTRTNKTILATRSFFTPTGIRVVASIRRRPDGGLFSTLITDGELTADDQLKATQVERTLREEFNVED